MSIPVSEIRPYSVDRNIPTPNHGPRTARHISLIVLHATAGSDLGAEAWMANADSKVSAHLHIRRDGTITRHVSDARRAWHAGRSSWPGIGDVNSESLGWEIGNDNRGEPYTDAQYEAVAGLLRHYLPQGLDRDAVVSHAMVAPGRKTDPVGWDWARMWRLVEGEPDLPEPDIAAASGQYLYVAPDRPGRESVRNRPVAEVGAGLTVGKFLDAIGDRLGPVMRRIWLVLVDRVLARLEEEAKEAIRERI